MVLDFLIEFGIPLGTLLAILALYPLLQILWRIRVEEDAMLGLMLVVIGVHAMLEFPLAYTYFLLPAGWIAGNLAAKYPAANKKIMQIPIPSIAMQLGWLLLLAGLGVVFSDYLKIEKSYQDLRYQWAHIKQREITGPPTVMMLNQLSDFEQLAYYKVPMHISDPTVRWMEDVNITTPSVGGIMKLSVALVLSGKVERAQWWMDRVCRFVIDGQCAAIRQKWESDALSIPALAQVHVAQ